MLLYYTTQVISPRMVHTNYKTENSTCSKAQPPQGRDDVIKPKKLSNPVLESPSLRGLHRELLVSHKWGLLPGQKCELQRVMDQRRLEQFREREQAQRPRTDLEEELLRRQKRLLEYELEEQKRQKELENVPEFVHVRDNLRHIGVLGQSCCFIVKT